MELTKKDILKYFDEINGILSTQNKFGEIIIAGGAALTLVYNARKFIFYINKFYENMIYCK